MGYTPDASSPLISRSTARQAVNNTGSTIAKALPVKITATGISTIDPSIEAHVDAFAGVTRNATNNGETAEVTTSGVITDSGLTYAAGTVIYVSKSGGITDVKPSIGVGGFVAGDFSIRLGVIVENAQNASLRDIILNIQLIGQL